MEEQIQRVDSITIRKKGNKIQSYKSHVITDSPIEETIIGLDANVLVDLVESQEFKEEIREYVKYGNLKIYTTNIALGEARHVLTKKRGYVFDKAAEGLNSVLKEFNIQKIDHKQEFNKVAEEWLKEIKKKMYIKKFGTFLTDCRILANLYHQAKINVYITEDTDIEKALKIIKLPLKIKIIGEAANLSGCKIREFFKERRKAHRK